MSLILILRCTIFCFALTNKICVRNSNGPDRQYSFGLGKRANEEVELKQLLERLDATVEELQSVLKCMCN